MVSRISEISFNLKRSAILATPTAASRAFRLMSDVVDKSLFARPAALGYVCR